MVVVVVAADDRKDVETTPSAEIKKGFDLQMRLVVIENEVALASRVGGSAARRLQSQRGEGRHARAQGQGNNRTFNTHAHNPFSLLSWSANTGLQIKYGTELL